MEVEIWKDIEEFKDRYQVSNFGRVRSNERFINARTYPSIIMTPCIRKGCVLVCLSNGVSRVHRSVAKLVLLTFADPPPKCAKRTKHLDGDTHNNRLDNLAWEIPKTYYALPNPQARELFNREAEQIVNIFVNKNLYNNISFGEADIDDFKQECLIRIWRFIDMVENYDYEYFYALCFKKCHWTFNTFYKKYKNRHRYIYFSQLISDETENSFLDRLPELSYTEYFDI